MERARVARRDLGVLLGGEHERRHSGRREAAIGFPLVVNAALVGFLASVSAPASP